MRPSASRHTDPSYAVRHKHPYYWSREEDDRLLHAIETVDGRPESILLPRGRWGRVALLVGSRTSKQCRERYQDHLNPSLDHSPLAAHEKALIEASLALGERRWCVLARLLHNRTPNQVKNAYQTSIYGVYKKTPRGSLPQRVRHSDTDSVCSVAIGRKRKPFAARDWHREAAGEHASCAALLEAEAEAQAIWDALSDLPCRSVAADAVRPTSTILKGCFGPSGVSPLCPMQKEGGLNSFWFPPDSSFAKRSAVRSLCFS